MYYTIFHRKTQVAVKGKKGGITQVTARLEQGALGLAGGELSFQGGVISVLRSS
jgi:hypothetical protein